VLGILVTSLANGQQPQPEKVPPAKTTEAPAGSVHRMVILQGPNRSVHYLTSGTISTRDRLAAFDLERAENDLTYVHDLQRLKQQYVNSERILEPQRRYVQEQLYGTQITYGGSNLYYGNYGYGGRRYYPYAYGSYGYLGGFGGGFGGVLGSSYYNAVRSLQYGMGNEGVMKNSLVQVIAHEATADYAAAAVRNYQAAAGRAAASPLLSRELSLRADASAPAPTEPAFKKDSKVTIWVGNDKYVGTVLDDRPEWVVLQTDKAEVTIRKAGITRSEVQRKP
jgi:hypothetical protein